MDRKDASDAFAASFSVLLGDDSAMSTMGCLTAPHVADAQQLLEEFVHSDIFTS